MRNDTEPPSAKSMLKENMYTGTRAELTIVKSATSDNEEIAAQSAWRAKQTPENNGFENRNERQLTLVSSRPCFPPPPVHNLSKSPWKSTRTPFHAPGSPRPP